MLGTKRIDVRSVRFLLGGCTGNERKTEVFIDDDEEEEMGEEDAEPFEEYGVSKGVTISVLHT